MSNVVDHTGCSLAITLHAKAYKDRIKKRYQNLFILHGESIDIALDKADKVFVPAGTPDFASPDNPEVLVREYRHTVVPYFRMGVHHKDGVLLEVREYHK